MRCEHLHDSAVYVLGALSPPEREAYERHLMECAECRAEVAQFADLPGLLGRLDRAAAEAGAAASDTDGADVVASTGGAGGAEAGAAASDAGNTEAGAAASDGDGGRGGSPSRDRAAELRTGWAGPIMSTGPGPAEIGSGPADAAGGQAVAVNGSPVDPLLSRVLDRSEHRRRSDRRRRRWQTAGTALVAACLGVLAVLGVRAAGVGEPETPDFVAMQEVASSVPVTAELALEPIDGGTLVHMRCAYKAGAAAGYGKRTYKLVVVSKGGEAEELDSWTAGYGDEYDLKARSHTPRADIERVEIRKSDDTPVLSLTA